MYWLNSIWQIGDIVHDTRLCPYYSFNRYRFQVFIHTVQPMPDTCFIRYICQNRVSSPQIPKLGNLLQVWPTHPRAGCHGRQLRSRQVKKYIIFVNFGTPQGHKRYKDAKFINIWSTPPSTLNHCVKRPNVSLPFVVARWSIGPPNNNLESMCKASKYVPKHSKLIHLRICARAPQADSDRGKEPRLHIWPLTSPVWYIDMTYRLLIYRHFWKISISISILIWRS